MIRANLLSVFLFIMISLIGCRKSGVVYGKSQFYPNNAKLEDPNKYSVAFITESISGATDKWNVKKYSLKVYNDRNLASSRNGLLYSEDGEITIGFPNINIVWDKFDELSITTSADNGAKIFERTLIYDAVGKRFTKSK